MTDEHDPADARDILLSTLAASIERHERFVARARGVAPQEVREANVLVLAALDHLQAELRGWRP